MAENNGGISNHKRSKELKAWVQGEVKGRESVHLPTLAHDAVDHFSTNQAFLTDIAKEVLEPAVYKIASQVLGEGRPKSVIILGDDAVTDAEFRKGAENLRKRFSKWYEHAGDRHFYLFEMNRPQLLIAAKERRRRASTELFVADFLERVANNLKTDDEHVSERFTEDELEEIWQEIDTEDGPDEPDEPDLKESA